jgi:hypothetical protein
MVMVRGGWKIMRWSESQRSKMISGRWFPLDLQEGRAVLTRRLIDGLQDGVNLRRIGPIHQRAIRDIRQMPQAQRDPPEQDQRPSDDLAPGVRDGDARCSPAEGRFEIAPGAQLE